MMPGKPVGCIVLLLLLWLPVCAGRLEALPAVVASADGFEVTREQVLARLRQAGTPAAGEDAELLHRVRAAVDAEIYFHVIDLMLAEEGIVPSAASAREYVRKLEALLPHGAAGKVREELENLAGRREFQINAALHTYFSRRAPGVLAVSNREIENAYRLNQERFLLPERLELAIIQIPLSRPDARSVAGSVRARLLQGENFDRVAAEVNPEGVTLPAEELFEALEKSGRRLEVNDVAPVLELGEFLAVVKVRGKVPARFIPLEQAAPYLRSRLEASRVGQALETELRRRLAGMKINYFLQFNDGTGETQ